MTSAPQLIAITEVEFADAIFDSIRDDYPDHAQWIQHAQQQGLRRFAVVVRGLSGYEGVAILKLGEAPSGQYLKLSTFKVRAGSEGAGIADTLLACVLSKAIEFEAQSIHTTIKPEHEDIIRYLERRGFRRQPQLKRGMEYVYTLDLSDPANHYLLINELAYDSLASEYTYRSESPGASQESPEYLASLLIDRLVPDAVVVEIGPGSGEVLAILERSCGSVVGVELSPRMAELASLRVKRSPIVVANIMDVQFPESSIDGIYAGAILHLFPSDVASELLRRMRRWLRPDGAAFINTSVGDSAEGLELKEDYDIPVARYRVRWTEEEFRTALTEGGFRVLHRATTNESERRKYWVAYVVGR